MQMLRMADRLPQQWEIATGRPIYLRHPDYFDPAQKANDQRENYAPLVWQCRFTGIEVRQRYAP